MSVRPIDHLVLPVIDIRTARERLTTLGFTVAADARHPFGTENACVYFRDKTYLEPLGIASEAECAASARSGNQFTARNNAFRFRVGPEGLSSVAMGSGDADEDHRRFSEEGISGGEQLQFSRVMKLPDGSEITPTFKLSFAADLRSPDFHGFTCQRINVPAVDRSALERHANGVAGIRNIVLTEEKPSDFEDYLRMVVDQHATSGSRSGITVPAANADIQVLNAEGAQELYGLTVTGERGLRGRMIVFKVEDMTATETLLASNGVTFTRHNDLLIVPHRPGQGVPFAFAE